jgi:hypothetical protein
MKKFAFISRHQPTDGQHRLAAEQDIQLVSVPDLDAFAIRSESEVIALMGNPAPGATNFTDGPFDGVICVHALIALEFSQAGFPVGVFNNVNRAAVGEKPQFETTKLVVVQPAKPISPDVRTIVCMLAEADAIKADIAAEFAGDKVAGLV